MDTMRICQGCGKPIGSDAIGGLCPACMVNAGLEGETKPGPGAATSEQKEPTDWPPEWVPPAIPELAKYFPYLEIIELLGHGGMGAVYKARHPELDCFVALKILSPKLSRDQAFAERFRREARALARLSHPNIVAVHDFCKAGEF